MINITKKITKSLNLSVYILERVDDYGYDEIIRLVVVANNEKEALSIANDYFGDWQIEEKVDLTKPGVILEQTLDG